MTLNRYFMMVPVYRLTKEKYDSDVENYIESQYRNDDETIKKHYIDDPEDKKSWNFYLREIYGGPWEFNEIIGFIKLYFCGNQIRGEYWAVNAKRICKTRRKQFKFKTYKLSPEISLWEITNESI